MTTERLIVIIRNFVLGTLIALAAGAIAPKVAVAIGFVVGLYFLVSIVVEIAYDKVERSCKSLFERNDDGV